MEVLTAYHWPGNIRQLENTIERAIALTSNRALMVSDIPLELMHRGRPDEGELKSLPTLMEVKLDYIEKVLRETGGNQVKAAEILGVDRKTLYRLLKKPKY